MDRQTGPWALIPARGGSKSIPKKNIIDLAGRPMMSYGLMAAKLAGRFGRIICSTDDREIALVSERYGVEVDWRPANLATDDAAVADVAREFLGRQEASPEVLVLVQPTSPFLLPEHVVALLDAMAARPECNSGQTITPVVHNAHAWNQRLYDGGLVRFMFAEERRSAFNKQRKPKLYTFGNLVAVRPSALLTGMDFFAEPSVGVEIDWPCNFDLDSPNDLLVAKAMLSADLIRLDHLNEHSF
jgi:CMP-N-acetylneuraminic acid synthetase